MDRLTLQLKGGVWKKAKTKEGGEMGKDQRISKKMNKGKHCSQPERKIPSHAALTFVYPDVIAIK